MEDLKDISTELQQVKEDLFLIQIDLEKSYNRLDESLSHLDNIFQPYQ